MRPKGSGLGAPGVQKAEASGPERREDSWPLGPNLGIQGTFEKPVGTVRLSWGPF